MKTFDAFNIDEKEKLFLELAHLDELEIKFDFIEYENIIFYFYKYECLFNQNKKNKYFYINHNEIWSVFEKKFGINFQETKQLMTGMVDKHFKLNGYTTDYPNMWIYSRVDKHFKLKD